MLTLTPTAATALSAARSHAGAPDSHGVRFFATDATPTEQSHLAFDFVESPQPDDAVTEESGLKAYVAPEVNQLVGDAVVDVETNGQESSLVLRRAPAGDGSAA